ncbi:hypothetical protein OVA29_04460 [Exiguobacterium sp. SL14]|nr:hypothetical protein [Exiguobacterium sp. SL14]MCY1690157.1 hypothetical protein [Exiguobacterium sp. SL14]
MAAERYFPHGYVPDALVDQLIAAFLNLETYEKQLLMRPVDGRTFELTLIPIRVRRICMSFCLT